MPSTSPKDTTEAEFIKYLNDKTVVFNNLIITGLLLVRTHGCKHCQTRGFRVKQNRADQKTGGTLLEFPMRTAMHGKSRVSSAISACDN